MATASWKLTGIVPVVWAEALWGQPRPIWGCCVLKEERRWDSARWRGWCWGWGRRRGRGGRAWCGRERQGWGGGSWRPHWSWPCSADWRQTRSTSSASNNRDGVSSVRPPESWLSERIHPFPRLRGFSRPRPVKHWWPCGWDNTVNIPAVRSLQSSLTCCPSPGAAGLTPAGTSWRTAWTRSSASWACPCPWQSSWPGTSGATWWSRNQWRTGRAGGGGSLCRVWESNLPGPAELPGKIGPISPGWNGREMLGPDSYSRGWRELPWKFKLFESVAQVGGPDCLRVVGWKTNVGQTDVLAGNAVLL